MDIRHIRDLALKILGIYYLSRAIIYAPQISIAIFSWEIDLKMSGHELAFFLKGLLPILFWIIIGLLLMFRTSFIVSLLWPSKTEEPQTTTAGRLPSLRFWIVLIGFIFFLKAIGEVVADLWIFAWHRQTQDDFMQYRFLPQFVTIMLSIICILKAKTIAAWLKTKTGEDSQPASRSDSSPHANAD